jgi:hypothetical protein
LVLSLAVAAETAGQQAEADRRPAGDYSSA